MSDYDPTCPDDIAPREWARIRALEAELAVEKMQHSVTIADEHESRSAFQHSIRALEAAVTAELALRQTAEAYAARNALRVIALQDALRKIVRDGDYTAPEGMKRIAQEALGSELETTDYGCTGCRSTPCICATLETKGEQGG